MESIVWKVNKRHERERLRDRSKTCFSEVCVSKKNKNDIMDRMCNKAKYIFENIIRNLSLDQVTIDDSLDELMRVFRTYVLTDDDRGNRNFRISARPEGLCAALLRREILIRKVPMTMLEFSKRVKVDRMTISCVFKRLDDYKDFHVFKRGRQRKSKKSSEPYGGSICMVRGDET